MPIAKLSYTMLIHSILPQEIEPVQRLLSANGWEDRVGDLSRFTELIANSQIALVATQGEEVIGFLRALTDGMSNGYISMVAVAEGHRSKGVGTALVQACVGANEHITWVLRAGRPGVSRFYDKLGFKVSTVAMERTRRKASDV